MANEQKQGRAEANELRAKWMVDRAAARKQILEAFEKTGGNAVQAAALLGIGHRTILRYMDDKPISAELEKIRRKAAKATAKAGEA